jgi:hypothetical protein
MGWHEGTIWLEHAEVVIDPQTVISVKPRNTWTPEPIQLPSKLAGVLFPAGGGDRV